MHIHIMAMVELYRSESRKVKCRDGRCGNKEENAQRRTDRLFERLSNRLIGVSQIREICILVFREYFCGLE